MSDYVIMGWESKQIKSLLNYILQNTNKSVISSITAWACKNNKKPFSVRNFFYKLIKTAKNDALICEQLLKKGINLQPFLENNQKLETIYLLENVLNYSLKLPVSAVCLKLANNNKALAQKLQNRYRNTLVNNPELVQKVINKLHNQGIPTRITYAKFSKVITMKPVGQDGLCESDLQALVMGVINLIRKDSEKKAEQTYIENTKRINNHLQKVLIDSRKKDVMLAELKAQNQQIKRNLEKYKERQERLQEKQNLNYLTIQSLMQSNKHQALQNFLETLIPQTQTNSK